MSREEALRLINEAVRENSTKLDLTEQHLTELPREIGKLSKLQHLYLRHNRISELPPEIGNLTQLSRLSLAGNPIKTLPVEFWKLTNLESLWLDETQLTTLPPEIGTFSHLKKLALWGNQLSTIPDTIGNLTNLRELYLGKNQLTTLPKSLYQLTHLQNLDLSRYPIKTLPVEFWKLTNLESLWLDETQLTMLPPEIGTFSNLKRLALWGNQLPTIPDTIGDLVNLQELYLGKNQLTTLPESLGQLTQLQKLDVSNNQLAILPESLQKLTSLEELYLQGNDQLGLTAEVLGPSQMEVIEKRTEPVRSARILEYYFRTRRGDSRPLNEAKLILVGRGGVGKTSLINRLIHNTFSEGESQTEGIQITNWTVHISQDDIRLNIWDFGGQEIMHATHQFFLTERSLYLLVLNGREGFQDRDTDYWLKLIESFGQESPVILILNKIKQCPFELNYRALKVKYPQILDFLRTDCEPEFGINKLHEAICKGINDHLPDVRAKFPASWFSIKDRLSAMPEKQENYLSLDRYRELCRQQGLQDEKAQDDLAVLLHRLGIALYYRDDPRLRDTSILNPHWVTNGIYRFLNAEKLKENKGILRLKDLQELLPAADYPLEKHEFLLELMRRFNLCFAFPNDQQHRYLIPELLANQEPDLKSEFDSRECLNFEYHYSILPEGLLPNFIVRTHIMSTDQARWRRGVVLAWEGCRALVKADVDDKKVTIRVRGLTAEKRRRLLTVIRSDFDRIHSEIPKLVVTGKVPVPGHPDVLVDYKKLIVLDEKGKKTLDEVVGDEPIELDIREMLNGVDIEGTRRIRRPLERGTAPLKLFYSYSHKDEALRDELETHLKLIQRRSEIEMWHDRKIPAGTEWGNQIDMNLEAADIILLLVSADFLASDYCYDIEMERALERHEAGAARVIPVILRQCDWNSALFGKLQPLPKGGKAVKSWRDRDSAWNDTAEGIRRVVRELRERKAE